LITIGLTGGIATGKSAASRLLAERGAKVVDVDRVAHETYAPGTAGFEAVVAEFGPGIVGADGAIDRRALGAIVFRDETAMRRLTNIVWPLIRERTSAIKAAELTAGTKVLVFEAALLIEAGWHELMDEVWLMRTSPAVARERLMARNSLSAEEADRRIAAQPPDSARLPYAQVVIDNDGDLGALEREVEAAWALLRARAGL
jgi:dephospho-CoA kinase